MSDPAPTPEARLIAFLSARYAEDWTVARDLELTNRTGHLTCHPRHRRQAADPGLPGIDPAAGSLRARAWLACQRLQRPPRFRPGVEAVTRVLKRALWCRWFHRWRMPRTAAPAVTSRDPAGSASFTLSAGPHRSCCDACQDYHYGHAHRRWLAS